MSRPKCTRQISAMPDVTYFKPAGVPLRMLEEIVVSLDEVEAIRLADLEGAYQEQAARGMNISAPPSPASSCRRTGRSPMRW